MQLSANSRPILQVREVAKQAEDQWNFLQLLSCEPNSEKWEHKTGLLEQTLR